MEIRWFTFFVDRVVFDSHIIAIIDHDDSGREKSFVKVFFNFYFTLEIRAPVRVESRFDMSHVIPI